MNIQKLDSTCISTIDKIIKRIVSGDSVGHVDDFIYYPYPVVNLKKSHIISENFIIYKNENESFFIKVYNQNNDFIKKTYLVQKKMHEIYSDTEITPPIDILTLNEKTVLIEKKYNAITLQQYINETQSNTLICNVIKNVFNLHEYLNSKSELSTFENLKDEITEIVTKFEKIFLPDTKELETIKKCVEIFLDDYKNKPIFARYTNGDFILSNILINGEHFIIIDYDKGARKTHLYFIELFQLVNSFNQIINYLQDLLEKNEIPESIRILVREFSGNYVNDKKIISQKLIYHLHQFLSREFYLSDKTHPHLHIRVHKFLKNTSNRLNNS